MHTKDSLRFLVLKERVDYLTRTCLNDQYTIERKNNGVEIHTSGAVLSGCLVKDIAILCNLYNWSFTIDIDSNHKPFIYIF